MNKNLSDQIQDAIAHYPSAARKAFEKIRNILLNTANESVDAENVEETLKWGEPAYVCKGGSTIRIAWSDKNPDQIALYFNCQTILVETFKELYNDELTFEKNRAVVFPLGQQLPEPILKSCISSALQYHKLKHLPLLGA